MVQSQTIGDAPATVVADQREGRKPELTHDFNELVGHGTLRIGKVIVRRLGYPASAVGAQVSTDHGVVLGKLRREESPHQASAGKAVHHQNGRPLSVPADEYGVARNFDFGSFEWNFPRYI